MYYSIVTFGPAPKKTVYATLASAVTAAEVHATLHQCNAIRVYECKNRSMAKSANIAVVRDGETIAATVV